MAGSRAQARVRCLLATLTVLMVACSDTGSRAGDDAPPSPAPSRSAAIPSTPGERSPAGPSSPRPSQTDASTPPYDDGCAIPARLAGTDVERIPGDAMALTFDGGSDATAATTVLDTLAAHDAPGTFFVTGRFTRAFPSIARRMAEEHVIGNHTDTHEDLTTLAPGAVRAEIRRAERAIRRVTGHDPRPYFRFPYGARDLGLVGLVNDACYVPFRWTVDTLGWMGTSGGRSADTVLDRVLDAAGPGVIVLMHVGANPDDGSTLDADALGRVIDRLRADGHSLVSLASVVPASGQ